MQHIISSPLTLNSDINYHIPDESVIESSREKDSSTVSKFMARVG